MSKKEDKKDESLFDLLGAIFSPPKNKDMNYSEKEAKEKDGYKDYNFEEEELEEDDYYYEDDK